MPDSFFDLAVGTFHLEVWLSDKRYDKHKFLIHDYFFAGRWIRCVPRGVVAFVTSKVRWTKEIPQCGNISRNGQICLGRYGFQTTPFSLMLVPGYNRHHLFAKTRQAYRR
jgi:hypothetical protein